VEITLHLFLAFVLEEVFDQLHAPAVLPRGKNPGAHCVGGWVGPRDGFERSGEEEKILYLPAAEPRSSSPQPSHYTDRATAAPPV